MKNTNDDRSDEAAGINHDAEQVGHHGDTAEKTARLPGKPATPPASPGGHVPNHTSDQTAPATSIGPG